MVSDQITWFPDYNLPYMININASSLGFDCALYKKQRTTELTISNNTPLYSVKSGPQINIIKQKNCVAIIFVCMFFMS